MVLELAEEGVVLSRLVDIEVDLALVLAVLKLPLQVLNDLGELVPIILETVHLENTQRLVVTTDHTQLFLRGVVIEVGFHRHPHLLLTSHFLEGAETPVVA